MTESVRKIADVYQEISLEISGNSCYITCDNHQSHSMTNFDFLNFFGNNNASNSVSKKRAKKQRRGRTCRIEELEGREMLSATPWALVDVAANYSQNEPQVEWYSTQLADNPEVTLRSTSGSFNDSNAPALAPLGAAPPVNTARTELSSAEVTYLQTEYADLDLATKWSSFDSITVLDAEGLTAADFQNAITTAETANNGLLVVRTDLQDKITLTGSQLSIYGNVTIVSLGDTHLTIDAHQQSRVFNIGRTVGLGGLTLTNGKAEGGGGILIGNGDLTLTNCTISGNMASGSGGGISTLVSGTGTSVNANLTITNCTISGNTAGVSGGGILGAVYGNEDNLTMTITNSTISGNTAGASGGGIFKGGLGGYVMLTLTDSTISGNTAKQSGGGIYIGKGDLTITDSTISGNTAGEFGGGIYNGDNVMFTLTDSTISGNTAKQSGGGIANAGTAAFTITRSTISGNVALAGHTESEAAHILVAIAVGTDKEIETLVMGIYDAGIAFAYGGGGIANLSTGTMKIEHSTISANMTLGLGSGIRSAGGIVTLQQSEVSTNMALLGGGGIFAEGKLTITDHSVISHNTTSVAGGGGGIKFRGTDLTITQSTISYNEAFGKLSNGDAGIGGGGIMLGQNNTTTITQSVISDNSTDANGGGICDWAFRRAPTLTITDSIISRNTARLGGGGIDAADYIEIMNSTISGNTAGGSGGGIYVESCSITNSTISDNTAGSNGGGICVHGNTSIEETTISGNVAANIAGKGLGGGIYVGGNETEITVYRSTIAGNSGRYGGGVCLDVGALGIFNNTVVVGNRAAYGGGFSLQDRYVPDPKISDSGVPKQPRLELAKCTVAGNVCSQDGGGVFNWYGIFRPDGTVIAGNHSALGTHDVALHNNSLPTVESGYSYNLIGNTTSPKALPAGSNNQLGTAANPKDPKFVHFTPITSTTWTKDSWRAWNLMPVADSPLVDKGSSDGSGYFDIAGNDRYVGLIDIGAYEYSATATDGKPIASEYFRVTAQTPTSVTLERPWTDQPGASHVYYVLEYKKSTDATWISAPNAWANVPGMPLGTKNITVAGLAAGTMYNFRLLVVSPVIGVTVEAATTDATTDKRALDTIASSTHSPQIGVTITTTLTPNGAEASYQWFRNTTAIFGATSSSYTPVVADVGYILKVVAIGTGSYEGTVEHTFETISRPPGTGAKPVKASGIKKTNVSLSTATISWKHNAKNTFYEVKCTSRPGVSIGEVRIVDGRAVVEVTGLAPKTPYKFSITSYNGENAATNKKGKITSIAKVSVKTKAYTVLTGIKKAVTNDSVTLTWKNSPFPETSRYEVYNTVSGAALATIPATATTGKISWTYDDSGLGLTPKTTYKFQIVAVSDALGGIKSKVAKILAKTKK